jgi:hypothetical protein
MSYRLEYQYCAFTHQMPERADDVRLVVAVEGGDNNLYEGSSGKRVRSWEVCMLGTFDQVLKQAVYLAGACEGGCLKPHGRDCKPESYIARIRRLITTPQEPAQGCWYPHVRVPRGHALEGAAASLGLATTVETRFGIDYARIEVGPDQRHLVFEFMDRFPDLNPWSLAGVAGLPRT